jgi:hypothetical protein
MRKAFSKTKVDKLGQVWQQERSNKLLMRKLVAINQDAYLGPYVRIKSDYNKKTILKTGTHQFAKNKLFTDHSRQSEVNNENMRLLKRIENLYLKLMAQRLRPFEAKFVIKNSLSVRCEVRQ